MTPIDGVGTSSRGYSMGEEALIVAAPPNFFNRFLIRCPEGLRVSRTQQHARRTAIVARDEKFQLCVSLEKKFR